MSSQVSSEAASAATALVRLKAALGDSVESTMDALPSSKFISPLQLADCFDHANCALFPQELRGLMTMLADWSGHDIRVPVDRFRAAVMEAPAPPPPAADDPMMTLEDYEEEAAPAPPPVPEAPAPASASEQPAAGAGSSARFMPWETPWEAPEPPAPGLSRAEQRQHFVRQARAAPWAIMPLSVAPQFEGERVRPAGAPALAWADGRTARESSSAGHFTGATTAAEAAIAARQAGKGAAGRGSADQTAQQLVEQSARAALLCPPNTKNATAQPWMRSSPWALHDAVSGLQQSPGKAPGKAAAAAAAAAAASPTMGTAEAPRYQRRVPPNVAPSAPFATWSEEQLGALHRADESARTSNKLGPTLWRPSTAPGAAGSTEPPRPEDPPAGLVAQYGEAGGGAWPVPKDMTWMNTSGAARPVSRRGGGAARPHTNASTFSFGW